MVSPARWGELAALPPAGLRAAFEASLNERRELAVKLGEPNTFPEAMVRSQLAGFERQQAKGRSVDDLVYYIVSSENVAGNMRRRLEARRAY